MSNILLTSITFLFFSCSSIQIESSKKLPLSFLEKDKHTKKTVVEVQKNFYLWGLLPNHHKIDVGEELNKYDFESFANLKIRERYTLRNTLWAMVSLGLWTPKLFTIEGDAKVKSESESEYE